MWFIVCGQIATIDMAIWPKCLKVGFLYRYSGFLGIVVEFYRQHWAFYEHEWAGIPLCCVVTFVAIILSIPTSGVFIPIFWVFRARCGVL